MLMEILDEKEKIINNYGTNSFYRHTGVWKV